MALHCILTSYHLSQQPSMRHSESNVTALDWLWTAPLLNHTLDAVLWLTELTSWVAQCQTQTDRRILPQPEIDADEWSFNCLLFKKSCKAFLCTILFMKDDATWILLLLTFCATIPLKIIRAFSLINWTWKPSVADIEFIKINKEAIKIITIKNTFISNW